MAYGASRDAWDIFSTRLGLTRDLLPVVSNPKAAISERSTMQGLGKTPSLYNRDRHAIGMTKWTGFEANVDDIREWSREPDYGICVQTRHVRALDIDVSDPALASEIADAAQDAIGMVLPTRSRAGSGKRLLAFRLPSDEYFPKLVIPVGDEIVEILGDGRQFIAEGTHTSGTRYVWNSFETIPTITSDEFAAMRAAIEMLFATGETIVSRQRRASPGTATGTSGDPRAAWLYNNWDVWDAGDDDVMYLRCPFEAEHTSDSGPTSTAYFPAGTGGYEQGHWRCLHAHCEGRDDREFDERCGYAISGFEQVTTALTVAASAATPAPYNPEHGWPTLGRVDGGRIDNTYTNIVRMISHGGFCGFHLTYDDFKAELMRADGDRPLDNAQWVPFQDEDYSAIRVKLEMRGLRNPSPLNVKDAVLAAAKAHRMDSAKVWLGRLEWDGESRVTDFYSRYLGVPDSPYARACSQYLWTAMAGRLISPGVQADMVPVWIGEQGVRKTSMVKAMVPDNVFYLSINLKAQDDDLARKMRGKLLGELEELRGLNSKESEEIKAWVTRTHEEWIPKYREFGTVYARRTVFIGTGNEQGILADGTGERRWLPTLVGTAAELDTKGVRRDLEQLWAEAAFMFRLGGISWGDAERLAPAHHNQFKVWDVWSELLADWLITPNFVGARPIDKGFTTGEAMSAVGIRLGNATPYHTARMDRVLGTLGMKRDGALWG
jgi:predicted P-loop ATPase